MSSSKMDLSLNALLTEAPTSLKRRGSPEPSIQQPNKRPAIDPDVDPAAYDYDPDSLPKSDAFAEYRSAGTSGATLKTFILTPREMQVLALAWDNMRDPSIDYDNLAKQAQYTKASARVMMGKIKRKLANAVAAEEQRFKLHGPPPSSKGRKTNGDDEGRKDEVGTAGDGENWGA